MSQQVYNAALRRQKKKGKYDEGNLPSWAEPVYNLGQKRRRPSQIQGTKKKINSILSGR